MIRKLPIPMAIGLLLCGVAGTSYAALVTIGTATYSGADYKLIYDADSPMGPITWLDYTNNTISSWSSQNSWASGLNNVGVLSYNLNPGVSTNWSGGWRLPSQPSGLSGGYNATGSEFGHLYYTELGNTSGSGGFVNTGDFDNLTNLWYWTDSDSGAPMGYAWYFRMDIGYLAANAKSLNMRGIAVRPGSVVVPEPSTITLWILAGVAGLGLAWRRRKAA